MIKRLIITLSILSIILAPFFSKPAYAEILTVKCKRSTTALLKSDCTVYGTSEDNNRQVTVTVEKMDGTVVASKNCTIKKDSFGLFSCKVGFDSIPKELIDKLFIEVHDTNTGVLLFSKKPSKGQNPCDTNKDGVLEPDEKCPTALGNIPTNPKAFAERILQIATGLGGGIAFILMVIGAIRVLTSSGDQQKLSGGRDMIVAAIAGLLFIIFSVLILQFIGVEIIGLSG